MPRTPPPPPPPAIAHAKSIGIATLLAAAMTAAAAAGTIEGQVVRVLDGDTLDVLDDSNQTHRVRLHGVDAPERGQPYSDRARQATRELTNQRRVIVATNDRPDRYGRTVGRVTIDGQDIALQLLQTDMVWQFTQYDTSTAYRQAETAARSARHGLWKDASPIAPWTWRRMSKEDRDKHRQPAAP